MVRGLEFIPEAVHLLCRVHLRNLGVESSEVPRECVKETMRGFPESWRLEVRTDDLADACRKCCAAFCGYGSQCSCF